MRYLALFAACALLLGTTQSVEGYAYGPNGQGNPYYCPAIPDEYVPDMDGKLSDWAWLPSQWVFDVESSVVNGLHGTPAALETWTRDDFDATVYGPAWIPSNNMWTVAVHKVDDVWYHPAADVYGSHANEAVQFDLDPDGSGGATDGINAQQAFWTMMEGGFVGCFQQVDGVPIRHAYEAPHCFWGATTDLATGSYDMEIMMNLWDELYPIEGESLMHEFEPGQNMGLGLWVPDRDDAEATISIGWHFAAPTGEQGASNLARLEILPLSETLRALAEQPSAVEAASWGAIKALLR